MRPEVRALVAALSGRCYGTYGMARCPCHDDVEPSLSIREGRNGRILWHCFAGCSQLDVRDALVARGLISPARGVEQTPTPPSLRRSAPRRYASTRSGDTDRVKRAVSIWQSARPTAGTISEVYLRQRAIDPSMVADVRHHDVLPDRGSGRRGPCLIAAVHCGDDIVGVQCTWLQSDGVEEAEISKSKKSFGLIKGGAVRLRSGDHGLLVAEGIETAASTLPWAEQERGVWATLGASNMKVVDLPPSPSDLIIAADNDDRGREAAEALARRAQAGGWTVRIVAPPREGDDWNDVAVDQRDAFEERAAIMEFDGGLTRKVAERLAAEDLRAKASSR